MDNELLQERMRNVCSWNNTRKQILYITGLKETQFSIENNA